LQEKWQKCNEKHQENRDDAGPDPIEYWDEVVASGLPSNNVTLRIDSAYFE
jgi:hypothetical protein